jgi:ABC-2 type transport system ATP-binding protein
VREQARQGACVLYTTHYMEEAQQICHRIGVIDRGRIIALGTLEELRRLLGERDIVRLAGAFDPERARAAAARFGDTEVVHADGESLILALAGASRRLPALFGALSEAGADVRETVLTQPSLESLFIKLTGRDLRE